MYKYVDKSQYTHMYLKCVLFSIVYVIKILNSSTDDVFMYYTTLVTDVLQIGKLLYYDEYFILMVELRHPVVKNLLYNNTNNRNMSFEHGLKLFCTIFMSQDILCPHICTENDLRRL